MPGSLSLKLTLADALEDVGEEDALSDHLEGRQGGEEGEVEVEFKLIPNAIAAIENISHDLPVLHEWSEDGDASYGLEHGVEEVSIREEAEH